MRYLFGVFPFRRARAVGRVLAERRPAAERQDHEERSAPRDTVKQTAKANNSLDEKLHVAERASNDQQERIYAHKRGFETSERSETS